MKTFKQIREELLYENKDACYHKVKSRYKVWPSAYASGALVQCRKVGADNWGNDSKNEDTILDDEQIDEKCWDTYKQVGMKKKGNRMVPNCVPNEGVAEGWSQKYKNSINCSHPKGFSQRAHCAGKKKHNENIAEMEITCPDCGMCQTHGNHSIETSNVDENLRNWFNDKWVRFGPDGKIRGDCAREDDTEGKPKCLPQSKAHSLGKEGRASAAARKRREDPNPERRGPAINVNTTKESVEDIFDLIEDVIDNLAKENNVDSDLIWEDLESITDEELLEVAAWQRKEGKNPDGGLNKAGIASYRRENPGSKLQMAVTTKPSKLKPGSKAANRRKSFCARMGGMKKKLTSAETARDPDSRINKALRKWNC
jgi:hypothetical protein